MKEYRARLIESSRALLKINDGRYMVPVEVSGDDAGRISVGLASSPDVDEADAEVVWVLEPLESKAHGQQDVAWVFIGFFGHTFQGEKAAWVATHTGEPNAAGVRELELEREGETGSARVRRAHRLVEEFLREIKFDGYMTLYFDQ
ncbi:MAG: hypothetical protein SGPRY_013979, partial [Prymnesium sp.]